MALNLGHTLPSLLLCLLSNIILAQDTMVATASYQ
jgi:hypothetical protein